MAAALHGWQCDHGDSNGRVGRTCFCREASASLDTVSLLSRRPDSRLINKKCSSCIPAVGGSDWFPSASCSTWPANCFIFLHSVPRWATFMRELSLSTISETKTDQNIGGVPWVVF